MVKTTQKKIIFCDNSLKNLINFRGDVINSYVNDGYAVVLIAPDDSKCTLNNSIKYVPIKLKRSGMNPISDISFFFNLIKIYKRERPDYVFHYTIKPNIYGSLAASLCGIRSTAMVAGLGYAFAEKNLRSAIARMLYKFAMRYSEYIFVLNASNREVLLRKHIAKPNQLILLNGGEGINLNYYK